MVESTGPGKLAPEEGMRPFEAGARGKGRGRLGHGPGRLWPWPRRPGGRGGVRRAPGGRAGDVSMRCGRRQEARTSVTETCGTPRLFRTSRSAVGRVRTYLRYAVISANS